jgi:uncharacterized membrane protein YgdD (TMEM256/DUF423 family)
MSPSLNDSARLFLALGAALMLCAVLLGAFGAHGLKARLTPELLAVWKTGVEYHAWHALGVLAVGVVALHLPDSALLRWSGYAMTAGIVVFSGSLYALALSGVRALGAVTPIGGAALLVAWGLFAAAILRS